MKYESILTKNFLEQKYWIEKLSTTEVAKIVDCDARTVLRYLIKYNILRRTRSEALRGRKFTKEWRKKLSEAELGSKNPNWSGGRYKDKDGYIHILSSNHPYANKNGYVFEHRLVVEKYIGRYLTPKEQVHHINHIRDDNRIENLIVFCCASMHQRFHNNPNNVKESEIVFDGRKIKRK